jgi:rhomboid protease GluP
MMDSSLSSEQSYQEPLSPPQYKLPLFPVRVIYSLIALNCIIFIVDFVLQRQIFAVGALVPVLVLMYKQWWRLLTAGFIHADIVHIGVNLYALYGLGALVERFFGTRRAIIIYLLSLFGANVVVTLLSPLNIPTVGASGAIMGMLGAAVTYFWRYRDLLSQGRRYLSELVRMAFINIGIGLLPGISLWGHLGGFLVGLAMGWILLPNYRPDGMGVFLLRVLPIQRRAWVYTLVMIIAQLGVVVLAYGWRV